MAILNQEMLSEYQTCPTVGYQSASICVAVPVEFGAVASVGDSYVSCNGSSNQDICTDCASVPVVNVPEVPEA